MKWQELYTSFSNNYKLIIFTASCFSVAVTKLHEQGRLSKKPFNGAYGFIGIEPMMVKQGHGGRNRWELMSQTTRRWKKANSKLDELFETSKLSPSNLLPPASQSSLSSYPLGSSIQIPETYGGYHTKATT